MANVKYVEPVGHANSTMWLLDTSFNLALFLLAFYLLKRFVLFRTSGLPYPPGPAGFPIINNLFDWPSSKEWEVFTRWARTYGILSLILFRILPLPTCS
jgi:hypothetical protein